MKIQRQLSFIYSAVRTPIGKFNGTLSHLSAPELGACAIQGAVERSRVPAEQIDEVILGNVVSAGTGQAPARQAALRAGLPESAGATQVNKVCGSGIKAVILAGQAIALGEARFIVAGGMESMSRGPFMIPQLRRGRKLGNLEIIDSLLHDGLWDPHENGHMGELCERLAGKFCFTRESQDAYAITSYTRARQAWEKGIFAREIVGVAGPTRDGGREMIEKDEQPFADDLDRMPFLPPVFKREGGTITKGNGAKINDGAAALVIGKEIPGLVPIARIVGSVTHSQPPATFGLAPVEAVKKVLAKCGLGMDEIDLFEINEAFAVISLAVNDLLALDPRKVNVHGGSIALGHPIGATGARILVTLIHALREKGLKRGLAALCIGGGEAMATVVEVL
ncbi:MAG: thiolase family protein [Nitrospinaceae bacterium]